MIHVFGSAPHYLDHLQVIWDHLGRFQGSRFSSHRDDREGWEKVGNTPALFVPWVRRFSVNDWFLVSAFGDASRLYDAGHRNIILTEHGTGQRYVDIKSPAFIGPERAHYVKEFWMPNPHAAKTQAMFTKKPVRLLPPLRIQALREERAKFADQRQGDPVVVMSFHSLSTGNPEQRGTVRDWEMNGALAHFAQMEGIKAVGHSHPSARNIVFPTWQALGVPVFEDFMDVIRYASVYVCDNSSTLFDAAACGIPVVLLNGRSYRPAVQHGLRFWQYADMGVSVWARAAEPQAALEKAIRSTLDRDPAKVHRDRMVRDLYEYETTHTIEQLAADLFAASPAVNDQETLTMAESSHEPEEPTRRTLGLVVRSLKDFISPVEGEIKQGQIFRPGYFHQQTANGLVEVKQSAPNPRARLGLLVSSKLVEIAGCDASLVELPPVELPAVEEATAPVLESAEETQAPRRRKRRVSPPSDSDSGS